MMSRFFRPENAQKRAREFLDVGKPTRALDVLYEVIRRGKMRNNCSEKVLEPIMFMYLGLCVDLKKSHLAKEGLYQYRNIFQSVNVSTLETVVRKYLELAEERTEAARKESHEAVTGVDDLDNLATPEEMLLKAVSGEDAQDRSDRTILTPWVKFLWESYRQCLELLRNNSRVEKLYHEIAKKAFNFCERYQRKTEFRKLCDNLLNHLQHLQKPPTSATAVSLSNPETQQMNLETRLEQLNYAIKMELWQEAYRAIEYVSDLMGKSKKSPKPQIMASYYHKLALVFLKAGNQLFHAAALLKLFQLNKEQKKNITPEEVSKKAAVVLVATMAIPLPSAHPEFDRFIETEKSAMEKVAKLALLLNLPKPPTRASLFKELSKCGVIGAVVPELQNLHKLMEVEFDPLNLCPSMKNQLVWVSEQPDLEHYVRALQEMTVTRLIKQLAQIYSTVTFEWLLKVAVFLEGFKLERILVDLVRHNDLQIRIDHRLGCVHFGTALSESQREDLPEGPTLQPMQSETIRCQLVHMNTSLTKCLNLIAPDARKIEMESVRTQCIQAYNHSKTKDHHKILQRQYTIEMRKERLENQTIEREESIRRAQEQQQQKQKVEEQERLKREATEREKQRQEEQLKQIHTKQIKDKLLQISQTSYGQKMIEKFNEEELLSLDAEEILQRQVEELEKERKELQQRLKAQEKKIDYMERAKRLVEIPKNTELTEKQKVQDREFWKQEEDKRIKKLVEEHRRSLEMSKRFNHMKGDISNFLDGLKSARRSETEKKMNDFKARMEVERKTRMQERKELRRKERREAYLREKREEEQRRMDEELKKEREAQAAEELARQKEEEDEYLRKKEELDRQEKIKKEKDMEIERKLRERENGGPPSSNNTSGVWRATSENPIAYNSRENNEQVRGDTEEKTAGFWRPGNGAAGGTAGGWRDKEKERISVWKKNGEGSAEPEQPRRERGDKDIRLDADFNDQQKQREEGGKKFENDDQYSSRQDDNRPPRRDEDSQHQRREEGGGAFRRSDDGGFRGRGDDGGNFRNRSDDGNFRNRNEGGGGGYRDRNEGGGGYRDRNEGGGGGFRDRNEGGGGGGFRDRNEGGGGFRDRNEGGGGGFRGRNEGGGGGYRNQNRDDDRGPRHEGSLREDGYGRSRGGAGFGDRGRWNNDDQRGGGGFRRAGGDDRRSGDGGGDGGDQPWRRGGDGGGNRGNRGAGREMERRPPAQSSNEGDGDCWRRSTNAGPPKRDDDRIKRVAPPAQKEEATPTPIRTKKESDADGWVKVRK